MKMKHHAPRPPSLMRKGHFHEQAEETVLFLTFECPDCNHRWHDVASRVVDSDCPRCDALDLQPLTWEQL